MNWFLLLVILLMCGGGIYEYQTLHGQVTVDEIQLSDLKTKLQDATSAAQKSADDNALLKKSLAEAQAKEDDLTHQLQSAQAAAAAFSPRAVTTTPGSNPGTPGAAPAANAPSFTTKLGTITALDGKVYPDCQLLKISTDSIVVSDADGITQVPLNVLPSDVQKMFGFDVQQGALSDDQVQALQQKLQAATASGK